VGKRSAAALYFPTRFRSCSGASMEHMAYTSSLLSWL